MITPTHDACGIAFSRRALRRLGTRGEPTTFLLGLVLMVLVGGMPVRAQNPPPAAAAPVIELIRGSQSTRPLVAPLDRTVSLDFHDIPLRQALDSIDRQAHLGLTYSTRIVPGGKRVTIASAKISAGEALARVLVGTGVRAVATSDGLVMLEVSESSAADTVGEGIVWGRISDSVSDKPIPGARIEVKGAARAAISDDKGFFFIQHVPIGIRVARARNFGFIPVERTIAVAAGQQIRVDFKLPMSATQLQNVVTTATGQRRLIELGNDITVINADSVVAMQPVASVTQLLRDRVPGLVVQGTSGAPGDPSRLRLRGIGSISLSNDPIVVVDGIRVYSAVSDQRSGNLALPGYATPSALDGIDVHSIDRIEVFKGPSAASMYGPDAAGGVIVIITKHGQAGPPRWTASIEQGKTYIPGKYPVNYLRWGHSQVDNTPLPCSIEDRTCTADSLVKFQALNDPTTSPLNNGASTGETVGVSGGNAGMSYSMNAHYRRVTGTTHLPTFESVRYVATQGAAPPEWMQHPDALTEWAETAELTSQLGSAASVSVTSMLTRQLQQRSNLDGQLGTLMATYLDRTTGTYVQSSEGDLLANQSVYSAYNTRLRSASTAFTTAGTADWHPKSWLTATANAGLNYITRQDDALEPPRTAVDDSLGYIGAGSGSALVNTVNLQATMAPERHPLGISMQLAVGTNYSTTSTADNSINGTGLPQGATSVTQAAKIQGSQASSDLASLGFYLTPSFHRGGLWVDPGIRFDAGSSFGSLVHLVRFPKVSSSYLVSSAPWFPNALKSTFDDLRLRGAYGVAGRAPTPTERLRLYELRSAVVDGSPANIATLSTLGNAQLRPERGAEFESGVDADLFSGRLSVSLTGYRKVTRDAILNLSVAPSVYGNIAVPVNIGTLRNTGFEASVGVDLLRTAAIRWREQVQVSHNTNILVSLNKSDSLQGRSGLLLKEGYPVAAVWAYPLLGYVDRNHDGIIKPNDLLFGDTLVYMGSPMPAYEGNLETTVGLLGNALSVDLSLSYRSSFTQTTHADVTYGLTRGYNDPTAPLGEQAFAASFPLRNSPGVTGTGPYGDYQQISEWRLRSLALTWRVPSRASGWLGTQALSVSLQGTNLWLRTNYRGKDPDVNGAEDLVTGFTLKDSGVLPEPRTWQLRINTAY